MNRASLSITNVHFPKIEGLFVGAFIAVLILISSTIFISCDTQNKGTPKPPNIIIILADDLGHDDLGLYNPLFQTPNLDQMAAQSVVFNNFYVNSICSPSRASLLTGRHFLRTGVSHVHAGKDFIHLSETLLSNLLTNAGYNCGLWGKWHSGYTAGYMPWDRGFKEAYVADLYKHQHSSGLLNGSEVTHDKWADEVIVDYAIDFIDRHQDQPFFAFVSSLTPHLPIAAPETFQEPYSDLGYSTGFTGLLGMVAHFDYQIGRLFEAIDSLGLTENTIIIFMSDNGPQIMTGLITEEERALRYIGNRKGHKGDLWENGVKSPLFLKLPHHSSTKEVSALADITDVFPTLLDLAGVQLPNTIQIDGVSLVPLLKGIHTNDLNKWSFDYTHQAWVPDDAILYTTEGRLNEYNPVKKDTLSMEQQLLSVRTQNLKLLTNPSKTPSGRDLSTHIAVFDLQKDPTESHPLEKEVPQFSKKMIHQLQEWWNSILDEPNAFVSPVFQIGSSSLLQKDEIFAAAPFAISNGLICTVKNIKNWKSGDWASYRVKIHKKGNYKVSAKIESEIAILNSSIHLHASESTTSALIENQEWQSIGSIYLTPEDDLIQVSITNPSINDHEAILLRSLTKLVFELEP